MEPAEDETTIHVVAPEATIEMGELVTESKSDLGWKNAIVFKEHNGSHSSGIEFHNPSYREINAIIRDAQLMIGSLSRPQTDKVIDWHSAHSAELDIDASLDRDPSLGQILVKEKADIITEVCICMDTSLSMTGEKYRIASIAIAATAMQVGVEHLSLICFDSKAHAIKSLGVRSSIEAVIGKFLRHRPRGLTNMESALKLARSEMSFGKTKRKHVILISDGRFTAGRRPDYLAPLLPRLHCIQTGSPWSKNRMYRRMASAGGGKFLHVSKFNDLPKRLYELARSISH